MLCEPAQILKDCIVKGAAKAGELRPVLGAYPEAPLLIPGIGAQGGSIEELALALKNHTGTPLIAVSRDISYISKGLSWKQDVEERAGWYKKQLNQISS
jgi:orotidine-5'-phosphate decarboxylase